MWDGQAAGMLQLVVQSQGNAWPDRTDIWTGKGQGGTLLVAAETG